MRVLFLIKPTQSLVSSHTQVFLLVYFVSGSKIAANEMLTEHGGQSCTYVYHILPVFGNLWAHNFPYSVKK